MPRTPIRPFEQQVSWAVSWVQIFCGSFFWPGGWGSRCLSSTESWPFWGSQVWGKAGLQALLTGPGQESPSWQETGAGAIHESGGQAI